MRSAKVLQYENFAIYANHIDISKCQEQNQSAFSGVRRVLRMWITRCLSNNPAVVESRQTTSTSHHLVGMAAHYQDLAPSRQDQSSASVRYVGALEHLPSSRRKKMERNFFDKREPRSKYTEGLFRRNLAPSSSGRDPLVASTEDMIRPGGSKTALPYHPRRIQVPLRTQGVAIKPPAYRYNPLSQPNTIRLLKLDTLDNSLATITCQLETVQLESPPPFFALSYCWGKIPRETPILCRNSTERQGQKLFVTPTLAQALRRLQRLSSVTAPFHRGNQHVGSINIYGQQLTLSELKSCISTGFHSPRCRERLYELAEELPRRSEEKKIVAGYIQYMESCGPRKSRFDILDDPTAPRKCTFEELLPVLDRLIQIEESDRAMAEAGRGDAWDLSARYFWIDQICIDQSNLEERNSQVKLMRKIYSSAIRTLIWIGDDSGDSHLALNLAEKIANLSARDYYVDIPAPMSPQRHDLTELPPLERPEWAALARLLSADWFNRTWII